MIPNQQDDDLALISKIKVIPDEDENNTPISPPVGPATDSITEPSTSDSPKPASAIHDLLGDNLIADNIYNTVDIAKSIATAPLKIGNDVLNLGVDAVNAGLRFFDDDEDDTAPLQIPQNKLPDILEPQTPVGKFAQTAATWFLGGKIIDNAVAARSLATAITAPGRLVEIQKVGTAVEELARVVTQPSPYKGGAVAEYTKEAIKDFILNSPEDDTLATYLKETGMTDHPFFDLMAIDDDDDYLIRRMKHSLEGAVIGTTVEAAFEAGRAGMKLLKWIGKNGKAEAAELTEAQLKEMLDKNPMDYMDNIGQKLRSQLFDQGLTDGEVTGTMHLLESYAAVAKRKDQSIKQYLGELNFTFSKKQLTGDYGHIRLEKEVKRLKGISDLGKYMRDNPVEIAFNITNAAEKNPGTLLHEFSHFFMWDTYRRAHIKGASMEAKDQWNRIAKYVEFNKTQTTFAKSQCETFAYNFEEWLKKGTAPNTFIAQDFASFKKWMQAIATDSRYVKGSEPEELERLYGRLFITPDMDDELKHLYQKGLYVRETADDIVQDFTKGTKETYSRSASGVDEEGIPYGRAPRTGVTNFDYRHVPEDLKIFMKKLEEATADRLPQHIQDPKTWDQITEEQIKLYARVTTDSDKTAKRLEAAFRNSKKAPAAAVVANRLIMDTGWNMKEYIRLAQQAEALGQTAEAAIYKNKAAEQLTIFDQIRRINGEAVTTAGRLLNAQQIPTGYTPDQKLTADMIGTMLFEGHEPEQIFKHIAMLSSENAPYGGDMVKIGRYMDRLKEPWTKKLPGIVNELFTNSLLSNPATSLVNLAGNAAVTGVSPLEYIVGGYISKGLSKAADALGLGTSWFKNDGDEAVRKGSKLYTGIGLAWRDARETAAAAWKNEASVWGAKNSTGLLEYGPERYIAAGSFGLDPQSSIGRAVDAIGQFVNLPSRALMSGDDLFKSLNGRAMLYADLWEEALSKGITSKKEVIDYIENNWDERVIRHIKDGTLVKEVLTDSNARDYALLQTFANDRGVLVGLITKLKQEHPLLHPLIPFVRTPARIVDWTVQRTPLGLLYKQQREAVMRGGAEASKILGQWAVGGVFIGSALMLAQSGKITGGGPANPQARKTIQDLGWQPYSIKVGDTWYSYNRLDPIGSFFGIVGDYLELTQATGESEEEANIVMDAAQAILTAVAKNTASKTYLQNIGSLISIIENPDISGTGKVSSYASQIAQGFVPRILTNLARDTGIEEPYMKEASGFLDRLKARTPGLSADLPTQYSWLTGEARTFGDYSLVNFTPTKESIDDQIHAELLSYGAKLGGPSRTQNGIRLSDEQYSRLCELHGTLKIGGLTLMQALEREVRTTAYQRLPEGEQRMKELNAIIGKYRIQARNQLKREYPELAPKSAWRYNPTQSETDLQKLIRYGQS